MIEISSEIAAWVGIGIVLAMFAMLITEIFPTEVVAISGAALMMVLGLLPYHSALSVLSNPVPWTIAGMFIVTGALVRTGALESFIASAKRTAK
jgi:di/tricarboxylate transporter